MKIATFLFAYMQWILWTYNILFLYVHKNQFYLFILFHTFVYFNFVYLILLLFNKSTTIYKFNFCNSRIYCCHRDIKQQIYENKAVCNNAFFIHIVKHVKTLLNFLFKKFDFKNKIFILISFSIILILSIINDKNIKAP